MAPKKEKYIRQRVDGRWEARLKVGEKEDGSPDIPSVYFDTRDEARAYVKKVLSDRAQGVTRKRSGLTLGQWCGQCLELYGHTLQDYTYTTYKSKIKVHIQSARISKLKLEDIKLTDLQAWANGVRVHPHGAKEPSRPSPKTLRDLRGIMSWLLAKAIKAGKLATAPDTAQLELIPRRKAQRKVNDSHAGRNDLGGSPGLSRLCCVLSCSRDRYAPLRAAGALLGRG